MLRQLFISGAVAACNMDYSPCGKTMPSPALSLREHGQYIECSAFHQNLSQLNQVAL
jgi:hypothetical protein